jgi:fatty-acyl-CoA synthase
MVTIAGVPEDKREAVTNEVHTLLAPYVIRHEVACV